MLLQDNSSTAFLPTSPLVKGSCGFRVLSEHQWPFWHVASLAASNPMQQNPSGAHGCGACVQVAVDQGPQVCFSYLCCTHQTGSFNVETGGLVISEISQFSLSEQDYTIIPKP